MDLIYINLILGQHGELKETIYMNQPEGIEILGDEHLVGNSRKVFMD